MAKKKFKLNPAGLLFLIAIAILIIALIAVIAVLSSTCAGEKDPSRSANASASPSATNEATHTPDPGTIATPDFITQTSDDPGVVSPATPDTSGLQPLGTSATSDPAGSTGGDGVVVNTPPVQSGATDAPSDNVYTSPTSAQKKNAKDGYVSKDKVNMRKGPDTKYDKVKGDIAKNTSVTLYELQGEWWFLKCGSSYGYIRKDMIKEGKPPEDSKSSDSDSKSFSGTVRVSSGKTAALRKSADKASTCIKEFPADTKVTIYHQTKGKDGKMWYYLMVNDTKQKGYIRSDLIKTSGKIPTK